MSGRATLAARTATTPGRPDARPRTPYLLAATILLCASCRHGRDTLSSDELRAASAPVDKVLLPDRGGHGADRRAVSSHTRTTTVVLAGDIAQPGRTGHARALAALIARHSPPVSALILAGDNARLSAVHDLLSCYEHYFKPASEAGWGQFDAITFPQTGNHEYGERYALGYFDYFAPRLRAMKGLPSYGGFGDVVGKAYYSFDVNGWHFVSLNSNCRPGQVIGGCRGGSEQERWLKADLEEHRTMPIVAVWHHPRYACGGAHAGTPEMQAVWADLHAVGADFVFAGHNHYYQRWKPLDAATPEASVDEVHGLTEIVVGSSGVSPYPVCHPADSRIAKQIGGDEGAGIFFLTVGTDGRYSFEYRLENGTVFDAGAGRSHHSR